MKKISNIVLILFLINIVNYADRYILPGMLPKLQEEFNLSLSQEGLLGSSYLLVFALLTIPLGFIADNKSRTKIISFCVGLWSMATIISAFAFNFFNLLFTRSFLGVGEAGYTPASLSLMGDSSTKENKSSMLSLWGVGNLIGAAIGFLIGGIIADTIGWRYAFVFVGIPGVILAIFAYKLKDIKHKDRIVEEREKFIKVIKSLVKIPTFNLNMISYVASSFVIGGIAFWLPTYIVNEYSISLGIASTIIGVVLILSGIIGIVLGGVIADFLYKSTKKGKAILIMLSFLLSLPLIVLAFIIHNFIGFVAIIFIADVFLSASTGPQYALFHDVVKENNHSTAFALVFFLTHLIGDAPAPYIIGLIGNKITLGNSLLLTTVVFILVCIVSSFIAIRTVEKDDLNL